MKKFFEYLKKLKYLLPLLGAWLGALGGQGKKEYRRILLPILFSILGAISLESWWGILLGLIGIPLSIGYGLPDYFYDYETDEWIETDEGSTLGRFWYNFFGGDRVIVDVFTRGTIGFIMCLIGLICPFLTEKWLMYFFGCALIMLGQTVFSWRGWGEVVLFGQKLLRSDLWNYGLIFTGYMLMLV